MAGRGRLGTSLVRLACGEEPGLLSGGRSVSRLLQQQWSSGSRLQAAGYASAVSATAQAAAAPLWGRAAELLQIYKQLSKARLSALVVCTAGAGYVAGSGKHIQWDGLAWTSLGTMMAAASANTLNQVYEVTNDSLMARTKRRPLPGGRITRGHALAFAMAMGVGGVSILAVKTNNLTAGLGAANIGLYAAVYTPLKVVSIANTWVGAVVGAIPPLMGWAAAAGQLDAGAGVLAAALYFWQLPHFLALAWLCRADYARGGYRMLSLVDPTGRRTAACALRNCIYLLPLGAVAVWAGVATPAFGYEAALVTGGMTVAAAAFYQAPSSPAARTLFRASLLHLPLFMGGLVLHRVPNTQEHKSQQQLFARLHLKLTGSDLSVTSNLRERWQRASPPAHTALHAASIAPFPFLPVPFEWRCPSKAACQSLEEEESADSKDAGEAEQISH